MYSLSDLKQTVKVSANIDLIKYGQTSTSGASMFSKIISLGKSEKKIPAPFCGQDKEINTIHMYIFTLNSIFVHYHHTLNRYLLILIAGHSNNLVD